MVKDKIRSYFNDLIEDIKTEYSDVSYSRTFNDSPASFPHIYFKRLDTSDTLGTLSGDYKGLNQSIEIHTYHNKGIAKAEDFAWYVRDATKRLGLHCTYFGQLDNLADSKIIQFVMRFSKLDTDKK